MGNYVGGSIPYGFIKVPNTKLGKGSTLRQVPSEVKWIKQIFDWYVFDVKNASTIAQELTKLGVPKGKGNTRITGTKWSEDGIRDILSNEIYRGAYIQNRMRLISKKPERYDERPKEEWIISEVPRCVNDLVFYKAQERLQRERRRNGGGGKAVYMLKGKLTDVATDKGFVGYMSSKGTRNFRRKQGTYEGKYYESMSIAAKDLEAFVWSTIEMAIDDPDSFFELYKKQAAENAGIDRLSQELQLSEQALSKANVKLTKLMELVEGEDITVEAFRERKIQAEQQRDSALEAVLRLTKEIRQIGRFR